MWIFNCNRAVRRRKSLEHGPCACKGDRWHEDNPVLTGRPVCFDGSEGKTAMELWPKNCFDTCVGQERSGHFGLKWIGRAKHLFERRRCMDVGRLSVRRRAVGKGGAAVRARYKAGSVFGEAGWTVHGV